MPKAVRCVVHHRRGCSLQVVDCWIIHTEVNFYIESSFGQFPLHLTIFTQLDEGVCDQLV